MSESSMASSMFLGLYFIVYEEIFEEFAMETRKNIGWSICWKSSEQHTTNKTKRRFRDAQDYEKLHVILNVHCIWLNTNPVPKA